jgi:hypothetical protein
MANFNLPFSRTPDAPTLSVWVNGLHAAAEAGTVPESFKTVTASLLLEACHARSVPVQNGRIPARFKGEVYFALLEMLEGR